MPTAARLEQLKRRREEGHKRGYSSPSRMHSATDHIRCEYVELSSYLGLLAI